MGLVVLAKPYLGDRILLEVQVARSHAITVSSEQSVFCRGTMRTGLPRLPRTKAAMFPYSTVCCDELKQRMIPSVCALHDNQLAGHVETRIRREKARLLS